MKSKLWKLGEHAVNKLKVHNKIYNTKEGLLKATTREDYSKVTPFSFQMKKFSDFYSILSLSHLLYIFYFDFWTYCSSCNVCEKLFENFFLPSSFESQTLAYARGPIFNFQMRFVDFYCEIFFRRKWKFCDARLIDSSKVIGRCDSANIT